MTSEQHISDELLPCPFCKAQLIHAASDAQSGMQTPFYGHPVDGDCILRVLVFIDHPDEIAKWNRRAQPILPMAARENWTPKDLAEALQIVGFEDATLTDAHDILVHLSLCSSTNARSLSPITEKVAEGTLETKLHYVRELASEDAADFHALIQAAETRIAVLENALTQSMTAIDDWLNDYAHDFCEPKRVAEARDRIYHSGTIAYIADVQEINRAALTPSPSSEGKP